MNYFSDEQLSKLNNLVREIEKLTDVEKLFLYLQLPCGRVEAAEGNKSRLNNGTSNKSNHDLFSKKPDQETTQTYTWILSHLEVDPNVSLPKQEVYDEYKAFCQANRFEPLCVADFGKAMKHAFPCIKPRRLGQRGNSRYCYSGLRKRYKIQAPNLPDLIEPTFCMDNDCSQAYNQIIENCRQYPEDCPLIEQTTSCYDSPASISSNNNLPEHQQQQQQQLEASYGAGQAQEVDGVQRVIHQQQQHTNHIDPQQHLINHMSLHFESFCASPFQSPASTPHPNMMNITHHQNPHQNHQTLQLSNDLHHHDQQHQSQLQNNLPPTTSSAASNFQDYYSNSDFIRYSS